MLSLRRKRRTQEEAGTVTMNQYKSAMAAVEDQNNLKYKRIKFKLSTETKII